MNKACKYCGEIIPGEAGRCPYCGSLLGKGNQSQTISGEWISSRFIQPDSLNKSEVWGQPELSGQSGMSYQPGAGRTDESYQPGVPGYTEAAYEPGVQGRTGAAYQSDATFEPGVPYQAGASNQPGVQGRSGATYDPGAYHSETPGSAGGAHQAAAPSQPGVPYQTGTQWQIGSPDRSGIPYQSEGSGQPGVSCQGAGRTDASYQPGVPGQSGASAAQSQSGATCQPDYQGQSNVTYGPGQPGGPVPYGQAQRLTQSAQFTSNQNNNYYNTGSDDYSKDTLSHPMTNAFKVFLAVIAAAIPGVGQIAGVIFSFFLLRSEDDDRRSFGKALMVASLAVFAFIFMIYFTAIAIFATLTGTPMPF